MNIFEYAMQMEKEGEAYYRDLAQKTQNPGLAKICTMLADEEVRHFQLLEKLNQNTENPEFLSEDVFGEAKRTFEDLSKSIPTQNFENNEVEFWKKAAEIEDLSKNYYSEKAAEASTPALKELLLRLSSEEQKHQKLLLGIADFVSRPSTWLEDAEWTHLEDY